MSLNVPDTETFANHGRENEKRSHGAISVPLNGKTMMVMNVAISMIVYETISCESKHSYL